MSTTHQNSSGAFQVMEDSAHASAQHPVSIIADDSKPRPGMKELIEKNPQLKVIDGRMQAMFQKFRQDLEPLLASAREDPELMEDKKKQLEDCFAGLHKINDFVGARGNKPLPPWSEAKKTLGIVGMSERDKRELEHLRELEDAEHIDYTRELLGGLGRTSGVRAPQTYTASSDRHRPTGKYCVPRIFFCTLPVAPFGSSPAITRRTVGIL
ncbi:hypothetical protein LTR27_009542 [Elasticomyces elasticus]|nr:hypothetical protein LTR27_009542 [Elasticomyces elasticus]